MHKVHKERWSIVESNALHGLLNSPTMPARQDNVSWLREQRNNPFPIELLCCRKVSFSTTGWPCSLVSPPKIKSITMQDMHRTCCDNTAVFSLGKGSSTCVLLSFYRKKAFLVSIHLFLLCSYAYKLNESKGKALFSVIFFFFQIYISYSCLV